MLRKRRKAPEQFASKSRCMAIILISALALCACKNTTKPSGRNQTGMDLNDADFTRLKKDLERSINKTLADMRAQGLKGQFLPSRSAIKKQFEGPLKANGCTGY